MALLRFPLLLFLLLAVSPARAETPEPFTLQLNWLPQAQFLGYFVAEALGYYEQEGLAVSILPGGPGIQQAQILREGRADAVVEWLSTALAEREKAIR